MTTNRERRAAAAAAVRVGDELIVTDDRGRHRARVTKAGPVWLTMQEIDNASSLKREWRLRRDTRTYTNDASKTYSYSPHWYTVQEWAEREPQAAAWTTVREQGISVHHGGEWNERIAELAQRLTAPLPRGTVHAATIVDGVYRGLAIESACGVSDTCVGAVRIRLATTDATIHLHETERVALIEALGGVA